MKVYIVRHGKAERRGGWDGPDPLRPLAPRGMRQSQALAGALAGEGLTRIVSSPHLRCAQTVEPLADATGLAIEFDDRLAEGRTPGESFELFQELRDTPAVLCSHGGLIPGLLAELEDRGAHLDIEGRLRCAKGSIWIAEALGRAPLRATYHTLPASSGARATEVERERLAVLDLGSTSFRLVLFEATRAGRLERVLNERIMLRLGAAIGSDGRIPDVICEEAIRAACDLADIAHDAGATRLLPVATAALRDARNGRKLSALIGGALGTEVRVITGTEEARLLFLALQRRIVFPKQPTLGLDLGGGSLELAIGDAREIYWTTSLPIGVTRLQRELGGGDPMRKRDVRLLRELMFDSLAPHRAKIARLSPKMFVAAGGTARSFANLVTARRRTRGKPTSSPVEISTSKLGQLTRELVRASHEERLAIPGLSPNRVDLLPTGGLLLTALADALDIDSYVVSDWGLREGVALDALAST